MLRAGARIANVTIFSCEELGYSLLEDGLYVEADRPRDAVFRECVARFLRASIEG